MRLGRAICILLAICFVACVGVGCGDSGKSSNVDAEGNTRTTPVRPGVSPKAAEKMKKSMPHL
jgi:hypothetical protein